MTLKTLPLLLIVLSLGDSTAAAQLPEGALKNFQWFSTLGYPDVKNARWAEIWSGRHSMAGPDDPPKVYTSTAFVTGETATEFTIVRVDLTQGTFQKSKADTPAHLRVGFEERSFGDMIKERLKNLKNPPKNGFPRFDTKLDHKAEVFGLAYVCWQRGEEALAAQLYEQALKLPHRHAWERKELSMREALEIELGHAAMWDAVLRCGGSRLGWYVLASLHHGLEPRAALLEAFRRVVRLFPRSLHVERARKSAAMLERMLEEDKKHITLSQEQIDKLPLEQRIAELVWLLRDQNGHQWGQPGACDVFDMNRQGTSPAHQLLAIGDAAAPALIEALTDDRFSRSVGYHRDFHFSHTILTVGDCALQILRRMTGQDFRRLAATSASGDLSDEDRMRGVQAVARQWWKEYQEKGKKQMLVDSIAAGKTLPRQLVEQLQKEAPEAVADAVLRGADNVREDWMARQFMQELASLKSPQATERLVRFMKEHRDVEVRLCAAGWLLNENHPGALPAVLHEWSEWPAATGTEHDSGFDELVTLLLASGDAGAMQKLVERWENRGVGKRFEIVKKLGEWLGGKPGHRSFTQVQARPVQAEARVLAIELLVRALEDTEKRSGMSGSIGDFSFHDPRICDFALWSLHEIDGKKYAFTPQAGTRQRETERIAAANLWRGEHQKPLLTLPPPLGPRLEEKDALKIVRVRVEPEQDFATRPLVRQAMELRGTAFGPKTLSSLLLEFVRQPTEGASGLQVEALRDEDLTGVDLLLRITPGVYPWAEDQNWQTTHAGQIGKRSLGHSGGSSSFPLLKDEDEWEDLEEAIQEGLKAASATTEFTFSAGVKAAR